MFGLESVAIYNKVFKSFLSSSLYIKLYSFMRYYDKFLPQISFVWEYKYIIIGSNFDFEVKFVFTTNGLYFLLSRISTSTDQTGRIITFYKESH
jgi:hypothetical protein